MSRRREELELQEALRLSTQRSLNAQSASFPSTGLFNSSSPIQIPSGFNLVGLPTPLPRQMNSDNAERQQPSSGTFFPPYQPQQAPTGATSSLAGLPQSSAMTAMSPTLVTHTTPSSGTSLGTSSVDFLNKQMQKPMARLAPRWGIKQNKAPEDDVVAGSEDEETEEELEFNDYRPPKASVPVAPINVRHDTASKHSSSAPLVTGNENSAPAVMGASLNDTLESFTPSEPSRRSIPTAPNTTFSPMTSSIGGFTSTETNTGNQTSSSARDPILSVSTTSPKQQTASARARPRPKQRKKGTDVDSSVSDPIQSSSSRNVDTATSTNLATVGMEDDSLLANDSVEDTQTAAQEPREPTPPLVTKRTATVYNKRSVSYKKRKVVGSDEEDDPEPTSVSDPIETSDKSIGHNEQPQIAVRESSVDPLGMGQTEHPDSPSRLAIDGTVDTAKTPLSNFEVVVTTEAVEAGPASTRKQKTAKKTVTSKAKGRKDAASAAQDSDNVSVVMESPARASKVTAASAEITPVIETQETAITAEVPEKSAKKGRAPRAKKGESAAAKKKKSKQAQTAVEKSAEFIQDEDDEVIVANTTIESETMLETTAAEPQAGATALKTHQIDGASNVIEPAPGSPNTIEKQQTTVPTPSNKVAPDTPASSKSAEPLTPAVLRPGVKANASTPRPSTPLQRTPSSVYKAKDGSVHQFRNRRDDLKSIIATSSPGAKISGLSRSYRIPSLHRSFKEPPKKLPPPPQKASKKKEEEEYSDEEPVDEMGRPIPKKGTKEWYMMEVD